SHNREYDVEPPYDIAAAGDLPADRFSDRELSWLAFNQRVLELAENDRIPLLERAKFLAIFASNLDEFYMVRIAGLKRRIAVGVRNPDTGGEHFARVKVPPLLPRLVQVAEGRFVPLEDVIATHLGQLFPGMEVIQHHTFRVTRNEDLEVEEDDAENLLAALERELLRRKFGPPVRLEVEESIDPKVLDLLVSELDVTEAEVFRLPGPLDLRRLHDAADL